MPNYVDNTIVLDGVGANDSLEGLHTDDYGEFDRADRNAWPDRVWGYTAT